MHRSRLFARFAWAFYKLLSFTWRKSVFPNQEMIERQSDNRSWIIAMWHGDELAIMSYASIYKLSAIVSTSKDGELMNNILQCFDVLTTRGSSTRGGISALKGLLRISKDGRCPTFAVDGPKGPIYKAKPGVFEVAKVLRIPIIPAGVYASHRFTFKKSWNQAYIPLPFSKVVLFWGEPMFISEQDDPKDPTLAKQLEERIAAAGQAAAKVFAN